MLSPSKMVAAAAAAERAVTDVAAATGELDVITLRLRVETGHW